MIRAWDGLAADIATVVDLPWGVHDQVRRRWLYVTSGFTHAELDPDYPEDGVVVCFAGSTTSVGSAAPQLDAVVEVADLLQTLVMDELGRGWPERYAGGVFTGLLEPGLNASGEPVWTLRGKPVCRFGGLGEYLESDD